MVSVPRLPPTSNKHSLPFGRRNSCKTILRRQVSLSPVHSDNLGAGLTGIDWILFRVRRDFESNLILDKLRVAIVDSENLLQLKSNRTLSTRRISRLDILCRGLSLRWRQR